MLAIVANLLLVCQPITICEKKPSTTIEDLTSLPLVCQGEEQTSTTHKVQPSISVVNEVSQSICICKNCVVLFINCLFVIYIMHRRKSTTINTLKERETAKNVNY